MKIFTFEKREDKILVEDISSYAISSDGKKVLVKQEAGYNLYDAKPGVEAKDKKTVSTKGLMVDRVPAQEWEAVVIRSALWDLLVRLPERLRIVVLARYGMTGQPRVFYAQIGAALCISGERARQLHAEALIWLRQPAHSQQLRSLLGRHTLADYEDVEVETQRWLRWRGKRDG